MIVDRIINDPAFAKKVADAIESAPKYPIREHSAHTPKPSTTIERCCRHCGASFLGLAPGKTGERGLWIADWTWVCSSECANAVLPEDRKDTK